MFVCIVRLLLPLRLANKQLLLPDFASSSTLLASSRSFLVGTLVILVRITTLVVSTITFDYSILAELETLNIGKILEVAISVMSRDRLATVISRLSRLLEYKLLTEAS